MKRVYTTANGKRVNIDAIIAQNESTIAVGNMKVNAKGDQLGAGGVVEVPKHKAMADYYKLNTPVATDYVPESHKRAPKKDLTDDWVEVAADVDENTDPAPTTDPQKRPLRGSLADSVAKNKPPEQEQPVESGPQRI